MRQKNSVSIHGGARVLGYAKNILIAMLAAFVLLLAVSLVASYTSMPEAWLDTLCAAANCIGVAIAGALCARKSGARGYLGGLVAGVVYMIVLYLIGAALYHGIEFDAVNVVLGALFGAIGGIVGVNIRR